MISPSSRRIDLGSKLLAYATHGVPVYWVIDPGPPVEFHDFRLDEATMRYELEATVIGDDPFETGLPFPVTMVPARLLDV